MKEDVREKSKKNVVLNCFVEIKLMFRLEFMLKLRSKSC